MPEQQQSFQNHARMVPAYHYFIFGALTINLVLSMMDLFGAPSLRSVEGNRRRLCWVPVLRSSADAPQRAGDTRVERAVAFLHPAPRVSASC